MVERIEFVPIHYSKTLQHSKLNDYILALGMRMLPKLYKELHQHIMLLYSFLFSTSLKHPKATLFIIAYKV
jgi:hypothetical protein